MQKLTCFSSIFSLVPARLVFERVPGEAPPSTAGKKKFKFKKKQGGDSPGTPDETPKPKEEEADKVKEASKSEQEKLKAEAENERLRAENESLRAENERLRTELQKQTPDEGNRDNWVEKLLELSPGSKEAKALFATLEARFRQESPVRPEGITFTEVKKALEARPDLLWSLNEMERTGGEPDVIAVEGNVFVFADVSKESPEGEGRRNLTYDNALKMAKKMGVTIMDAPTYRQLQDKISLDAETWSWLLTTDPKMLQAGDALRGYRHDGDVVVYGNDADHSYPRMGWRASLRVPKS